VSRVASGPAVVLGTDRHNLTVRREINGASRQIIFVLAVYVASQLGKEVSGRAGCQPSTIKEALSLTAFGKHLERLTTVQALQGCSESQI